MTLNLLPLRLTLGRTLRAAVKQSTALSYSPLRLKRTPRPHCTSGSMDVGSRRTAARKSSFTSRNRELNGRRRSQPYSQIHRLSSRLLYPHSSLGLPYFITALHGSLRTPSTDSEQFITFLGCWILAYPNLPNQGHVLIRTSNPGLVPGIPHTHSDNRDPRTRLLEPSPVPLAPSSPEATRWA